MAKTKTLPPVHPGEILREEFLVPLKISSGKLASVCRVPRTRIERLVNEETSVTADTALRLGKALKTSPQLWLNLQTAFDIKTAEREIAATLAEIETLPAIEHAA